VSLPPSDGPRSAVIINPTSGPPRRGGAAARVRLAWSTLERLGVVADVHVTERPGHAHELALAAVEAGARLVVAWGGDGTINEVGRALVHRPVSLGIVPAGSGNGLARDLGLSFNPRRALERALGSPDRVIDAGEIGGKMFFNVAGIGLDAHVAAAAGTRENRRGLIPYLLTGARNLASYRPTEYSLEIEGAGSETAALAVVIANSRQYGFNAQIAPTAALDDGVLDLVVIESRSLVGNLIRLPSLFLGSIHRQVGVRVSKVRSMVIRARTPMLFHVDGEAIEGGIELVTRVHAGALSVRA
jgi:YegS/Rv2252/BmrU family lipid kinase